jgi:hypothetical protein
MCFGSYFAPGACVPLYGLALDVLLSTSTQRCLLTTPANAQAQVTETPTQRKGQQSSACGEASSSGQSDKQKRVAWARVYKQLQQKANTASGSLGLPADLLAEAQRFEQLKVLACMLFHARSLTQDSSMTAPAGRTPDASTPPAQRCRRTASVYIRIQY